MPGSAGFEMSCLLTGRRSRFSQRWQVIEVYGGEYRVHFDLSSRGWLAGTAGTEDQNSLPNRADCRWPWASAGSWRSYDSSRSATGVRPLSAAPDLSGRGLHDMAGFPRQPPAYSAP